jgi:hypothetical protein
MISEPVLSYEKNTNIFQIKWKPKYKDKYIFTSTTCLPLTWHSRKNLIMIYNFRTDFKLWEGFKPY